MNNPRNFGETLDTETQNQHRKEIGCGTLTPGLAQKIRDLAGNVKW